MNPLYVVYYYESLQDGHEEIAKVIGPIEEALRYASNLCNGYNRHNKMIRIFKLGEEVEIEEVIDKKAVIVEQETKKFKLKEK